MKVLHYQSLVVGFVIAAMTLFVLNGVLSTQTKTKIYKLFACGSCPHQDLEEQLKLWNERIHQFNQTYSDIDAQILQMRLENEKCWIKLNANQLDVAKEELEVCGQTVKQIIDEMTLYSEEQQRTKRVLEQDLDNYADLIVD